MSNLTTNFLTYPLIKEYSEKFKNPLHMINKLENLEVIGQNNLTIPKIIVVGDKKVGKSSVVSNLTGILYPGSIDVPIIIKFEFDSTPGQKLYLRYESRTNGLINTKISQDNIAADLVVAINSLTENKKENVLTLVVMQPHVADLTIVDLPGINTYSDVEEQRKALKVMEGYVLEQTRHEECLFVNVISATKDFKSCLSTKVINQFDMTGKKTVCVVSKVDLCVEDGMIIHLTLNKVNTIFGYFFVKNVSDEISTVKENVFSCIDEKYFGIDKVAKCLVNGMFSIIFKPSSLLVTKIDAALIIATKDLENSEKKFCLTDDALPTILDIISNSQITLYKLFFAQDYSEYHEMTEMHLCARLIEKLRDFYPDLIKLKDPEKNRFLVDEIDFLIEKKWSCPSLLISSTGFNRLLDKHVELVSRVVKGYTSKVWDYIEWVVYQVLLDRTRENRQLHSSLKKSARKMVEHSRLGFEMKVEEILKLEKISLHTCDPDFLTSWEKYKLIKLGDEDFKEKVAHVLGEFDVDRLKKDFPSNKLQRAFHTKMMMVAYCECVSKRTVDYFTLNLMGSTKDMVSGGMGLFMTEYFLKKSREAEDDQKLLDEEPVVSINRANLQKRTAYLGNVKKEIEMLQNDFEFLL